MRPAIGYAFVLDVIDPSVVLGLEGAPLVLADWPYDDLGKGYPSEDLIVGVMSFDPPYPICGQCSIHSSVSYYRDWITKTMAGTIPSSKCLPKPKAKPFSTEHSVGCDPPYEVKSTPFHPVA